MFSKDANPHQQDPQLLPDPILDPPIDCSIDWSIDPLIRWSIWFDLIWLRAYNSQGFSMNPGLLFFKSFLRLSGISEISFIFLPITSMRHSFLQTLPVTSMSHRSSLHTLPMTSMCHPIFFACFVFYVHASPLLLCVFVNWFLFSFMSEIIDFWVSRVPFWLILVSLGAPWQHESPIASQMQF